MYAFFFLIYLFLAVLGLCCCMDFSLVAESGSNSLVIVCRLLIVMASLVKHGLRNTDSRVVAHRFGCSIACGVFPDQGSNTCLLHCQLNSLPLSHQGSPGLTFLIYVNSK